MSRIGAALEGRVSMSRIETAVEGCVEGVHDQDRSLCGGGEGANEEGRRTLAPFAPTLPHCYAHSSHPLPTPLSPTC